MKRFVLFWLFLFSTFAQAESFLEHLGGKKNNFLSPEKAFNVQVESCEQNELLASFQITPGYYLYRDRLSFTAVNQAPLANIQLPAGEDKNDPTFGKIKVYHQSFQAKIVLNQQDRKNSTQLVVGYQGCSDQGLCYPPVEKTFNVDFAPHVCAMSSASEVPANENTRIAKVLQQGNFWLVVSFFFGAGLLLAFTPCVFPMIPILSGIIVGRGQHITRRQAFILSLSYVLGMALTYAAAGIAAGLSGELISNALQTPWVLGSFAAIFVVLSLSMFGFYELQLPSALQSRLSNTSNQLHGGHLSGVFAMGALSAVIMSPCVAAPMAGALLYIGQTHNALLGGTALFALALGMGAPLLLVGTSAGALLPKAGAWMENVKKVFGVLMLALAIWIISPLISVVVQMALWSILLILLAILLGILQSLPAHASIGQKASKGFGLLALLFGIAYLIGALSGAPDVLRPLSQLGHGTPVAKQTLRFERVKSLAALQARLAEVPGQTVMLDFYADWCVSCKEMERETFTDPTVQAALKNVLLLQADVTANNVDDKALLQHFQLFGPPATLFFDAHGKELTDFRVTGFQNAEQFLQSLKNAGI